MGLIIAIESQLSFSLVDSFDAFELKPGGKTPDLTIKLTSAERMNLSGFQLVKRIQGNLGYAIYENKVERRKISYEEKDSSILRWCVNQRLDSPNCCEIQIFDVWKSNLQNLDPFLVLGLPEFLAEYHALLLHASLIRQEDRGILFTAPSGTGKSTQAELWEKYHEAEILNGDRALIRKLDTGYWVYGSPYAGSSYLYKNEKAPLKAIVVLRQAQNNRLVPLHGKQAFLHLTSQMLLCRELPTVMNRQLDALMDLMTQVPIYLLECRPDQEATDILYEALKENM